MDEITKKVLDGIKSRIEPRLIKMLGALSYRERIIMCETIKLMREKNERID